MSGCGGQCGVCIMLASARPTFNSDQVQEGYGACSVCFGYALLHHSRCLGCTPIPVLTRRSVDTGYLPTLNWGAAS